MVGLNTEELWHVLFGNYFCFPEGKGENVLLLVPEASRYLALSAAIPCINNEFFLRFHFYLLEAS